MEQENLDDFEDLSNKGTYEGNTLKLLYFKMLIVWLFIFQMSKKDFI